MREYFSLNGHLIDPKGQAGDFCKDRGLAYGHGLFESILYRESEVPLVERHLHRICHDAKVLGIEVKPLALETYLYQFINSLKEQGVTEGVIKIIVTAGTGGRGYAPPSQIEPSVICTYSPLPPDLPDQGRGITVRCCNHRLPINTALAGLKHLNRLDQVLAWAEWNSADYDEGLMLDSGDKLIEAISANIFINIDGNWLTPDLKDAGVCGVMRSLLLSEVFLDSQMQVKVANIDIKQLNFCQEMFICNSIRGIVPVTAIYSAGGKLLKSLPRGEQTLMLRSQLISKYSHYQ